MSKNFAVFVALIVSVGCGGATGDPYAPGDAGQAGKSSSGAGGKSGSGNSGSSNGGTNSGGKGSAGEVSGGSGNDGGSSGGHAGTATGGSGTAGMSGGGMSGGGMSGGGGSGGADPRCPPKTPSGSCTEQGVSCPYNPSTQCLCTGVSTPFAFCQQLDPDCSAGSGGFSAKIAVPAYQRCTCSAGSWMCAYGI